MNSDATRCVHFLFTITDKSEEMIYVRTRADPSPRAENLFKIQKMFGFYLLWSCSSYFCKINGVVHQHLHTLSSDGASVCALFILERKNISRFLEIFSLVPRADPGHLLSRRRRVVASASARDGCLFGGR